jgi:hypothetical protein
MKEVKNILPNSVLVNLYKESLVLGVAPSNVDKKKQASPPVEQENAAIAAEEPLIAPIKFLGEHQKKDPCFSTRSGCCSFKRKGL